MAQNRMRDMTDDQLTDEVAHGGDIAAVNEMTRRLKNATESSQNSMIKLTKWLIIFTITLVIFGFIQVFLVVAQEFNR